MSRKKGKIMTIFTRTKRIIASVSLATMTALLAMSVLPSTAHATPVTILQVSIEMPAIPCNEFRAGGVNPGSVNRAHKKIQELNRPTSANEAWGVMAVSIIAYCPEHYGVAPTVDGVPYGPWLMIPTTAHEQPIFMAYWNGRQACSASANSGPQAGVQALMRPDWRVPYGISENDAKVAMLISAATLCPAQMGAVRSFLGG